MENITMKKVDQFNFLVDQQIYDLDKNKNLSKSKESQIFQKVILSRISGSGVEHTDNHTDGHSDNHSDSGHSDNHSDGILVSKQPKSDSWSQPKE